MIFSKAGTTQELNRGFVQSKKHGQTRQKKVECQVGRFGRRDNTVFSTFPTGEAGLRPFCQRMIMLASSDSPVQDMVSLFPGGGACRSWHGRR